MAFLSKKAQQHKQRYKEKRLKEHEFKEHQQRDEYPMLRLNPAYRSPSRRPKSYKQAPRLITEWIGVEETKVYDDPRMYRKEDRVLFFGDTFKIRKATFRRNYIYVVSRTATNSVRPTLKRLYLFPDRAIGSSIRTSTTYGVSVEYVRHVSRAVEQQREAALNDAKQETIIQRYVREVLAVGANNLESCKKVYVLHRLAVSPHALQNIENLGTLNPCVLINSPETLEFAFRILWDSDPLLLVQKAQMLQQA